MLRVLGSIAAAATLLAVDVRADLHRTIRYGQQRVVKIYGAGGLKQLESYQTGILISPDGHVLTALSYVLDVDDVAVVLDDGSRFVAEWVGSDPILEIAILKIPADGQRLPCFSLEEAASLDVGDRVLAASNLYGIAAGDEPVSVLQGVVSAIAPLSARRGRFQANYRGQVYIVDADANNPGAAGGALLDWQGRLAGVLGKELRSNFTGAWLHYAIPIDALVDSVDAIIEGRVIDETALELPEPDEPLTAADLGIALVPNLLPRTPPYIDRALPDSPAAASGLRADDLIVFIGAEPIASCREMEAALAKFERSDEVQLSILRDGALREFTLAADPAPGSTLRVVDEPGNN